MPSMHHNNTPLLLSPIGFLFLRLPPPVSAVLLVLVILAWQTLDGIDWCVNESSSFLSMGMSAYVYQHTQQGYNLIYLSTFK